MKTPERCATSRIAHCLALTPSRMATLFLRIERSGKVLVASHTKATK